MTLAWLFFLQQIQLGEKTFFFSEQEFSAQSLTLGSHEAITLAAVEVSFLPAFLIVLEAATPPAEASRSHSCRPPLKPTPLAFLIIAQALK